MDGIQTVINRIAHRLERAVYLEDAVFRPLATSAQLGHIDDARIEALLARKPADPHLEYFINSGVVQAKKPVRIPPSEYHGLAARLVIPVVSGTRVLARLWLIDSSPPVADHEIEVVRSAALELVPYLDETTLERQRRAANGSNFVRGLIHAGRGQRERLFEQWCNQYGVHDLRESRACVVNLRATVPQQTDDGLNNLSEALVTLTDLLDVHRAAGTVLDGGLHMLFAPQLLGGKITSLLSDAAKQTAFLHGLEVVSIGISGRLNSSHGLDEAFRHASYASRIVRCTTSFGKAACWDDLNIYKLFADMEWNLAGVAALHAGTAVLLREHPRQLASSLLTYLERQGDVEEAADELHVHRTTLYYRLKRASDALGESATGPNRFAIHAALKFASLLEALPHEEDQTPTEATHERHLRA